MKYYFSVCVDVVKNLITLDGRNIPAEKRIMVQTNTNPLHTGKISHTDLVLLQQINYPNIGTHILPVNHPRPIIIVLVGAPGSRKGFTVKKFCRTNKM